MAVYDLFMEFVGNTGIAFNVSVPWGLPKGLLFFTQLPLMQFPSEGAENISLFVVLVCIALGLVYPFLCFWGKFHQL